MTRYPITEILGELDPYRVKDGNHFNLTSLFVSSPIGHFPFRFSVQLTHSTPQQGFPSSPSRWNSITVHHHSISS